MCFCGSLHHQKCSEKVAPPWRRRDDEDGGAEDPKDEFNGEPDRISTAEIAAGAAAAAAGTAAMSALVYSKGYLFLIFLHGFQSHLYIIFKNKIFAIVFKY